MSLVAAVLVLVLSLSGMALAFKGDLKEDGCINWLDIDTFASKWLNDCNSANNWCDGADIDYSNDVDFGDFTLLAGYWRQIGASDPNLVGLWRLDESAGSTAYDTSGKENNGTLLYGVVWVPTGGKIGGAASFRETDNRSRIEISTAMGMTPAAGTIVFWARPAASQPLGWRFMFGCKNDAGNRIQLYMKNGTWLDLGLGDTYARRENIRNLSTETWYHIALTWDGSNYAVYVNGDETVVSGTYTGLNTLSDPANIGNNGDAKVGDRNEGFPGLIDEVGIWNIALDADEVMDVYLYGIPKQVFARAYKPDPQDEATSVAWAKKLSWSPGDYADSHDVYFGTNESDVNNADNSWPVATGPNDPNVYKGNQEPNIYDPCELNLGTTYYWRIDEANGVTVCKGYVWSFTTVFGPPSKASNPSPPNGVNDVGIYADLSWMAGADTTSHDVYFGTDSTPDETEFKGNQTATTFDPGIMDCNTVYYWRIDEKNAYGTTTGVVWSFTTGTAAGPTPAFPGAEGPGKWTVGGRGGQVIKVTNLYDSGTGSLRAAVNTTGARIVVFEVSGTIDLQSRLDITNPYITIAGQTAPGDGICLKDYGVKIAGTNEVIVRYIRCRPGDNVAFEPDSIAVYYGNNVILDHVSASWSVDETLSVTHSNDVTVQWCMISESLNYSTHSDSPHGYASLINGEYGAEVTYHHNLYAHHKTRCPRPGGHHNYIDDPDGWIFDWRNNVIYSWLDTNPGYNSDTNRITKMNFVGNYYKNRTGDNTTQIFLEKCTYAKAYIEDNSLDESNPEDQWTLWRWGPAFGDPEKEAYKQSSPFDVVPVTTTDPNTAYTQVLNNAGATLPARDPVDTRIVNDVINGTGNIINDEDEVGGWPTLESTTPPTDTDNDGMPDDWEIERGLNPDVNDSAGDDDGDGYTNIEEYINGIPW